jgi:MOSC domain-containing protein YiiM
VATTKGTIEAISISKHRGTKKQNIDCAELRADCGIVGDAHAGNWHRQLSLLGADSIEKMLTKGAEVGPGDFAENITTKGLDLSSLIIGSRLKLGADAEVRITQFGKECHSRCEIFKQVGDCVMPREGIFAEVIKGGSIRVGDAIQVLNDNG